MPSGPWLARHPEDGFVGRLQIVSGSAFEVHDMLSSHVDRVLLANPVDLKRLGSGRHTDRVDAARLAKMLAVGTLPTVWVPPQPMREVRRLLYYRARLASNRRRAINRGFDGAAFVGRGE